jgi:hypothetical protein
MLHDPGGPVAQLLVSALPPLFGRYAAYITMWNDLHVAASRLDTSAFLACDVTHPLSAHSPALLLLPCC